MTIYAMETGFLARLKEDRKELLAIARSLGTADEMRKAREDLMQSLSAINITPKAGKEAEAYRIFNGVAHIPVVGELTPHAETDACGGYTANALTEYGFIVAALASADSNKAVDSIQLNISSPGGYLSGLMGAVNAVRKTEKHVTAFVQTMAASAAYFIASQADEIVAESAMSEIGSIGVRADEYDDDAYLKSLGVDHRVYTSTNAPDKAPDTKTKEGQKKIIELLDENHRVFVQYVAEGRETTAENVNKNFGRGGLLLADKALAAGMIDRIESVPSRREEDLADVVGNTAATADKNHEEVKMNNLEELKNEAPGLYAEAVKIGQEQERARVTALMNAAEADPDNLKLAEVTTEAIRTGAAKADIQEKINVAIRDGGKLSGENAPDVNTVAGLEPLSAEDLEAAKLVGMTADEYRKYSKEA